MTIERIKKGLLRRWRKWRETPYVKNPRYATYWMDHVLSKQSIQLVQIGSNDGKTGDPLHEILLKNKLWQGLFVEPIPYLFERLKSNYPSSSRFRFVKAAITAGENIPFYYVDPCVKDVHPELPYWFDQLGSFDRDHLINELDGKLEPFLIELNVKGLSLNDLFDQNEIKQIDILHIDVEGYDWNVLKQLDLGRFNPKFILFEHHHLKQVEKTAAYAKLNGTYELFEIGIDWLAAHKELPRDILRKMRAQLNRISSEL